MKRLIMVVLAFLIVDAVIAFVWVRERSDNRFDREILVASAKYGVDPALIKAVVRRESAFNPAARGTAGEIGLMQLQEIAAQEWADAERNYDFIHDHCLDPQTNIFAGTFYLAKVLKRYQHADNPLAYGLADYNAGRSHVLRWKRGEAETNSAMFLAQMDYPGTRKYIEEVLRWRNRYAGKIR